MMQDEKYRMVNKKFGGIFISSNHQKSLIIELMACYSKENERGGVKLERLDMEQ
jgi:hypothetical protein